MSSIFRLSTDVRWCFSILGSPYFSPFAVDDNVTESTLTCFHFYPFIIITVSVHLYISTLSFDVLSYAVTFYNRFIFDWLSFIGSCWTGFVKGGSSSSWQLIECIVNESLFLFIFICCIWFQLCQKYILIYWRQPMFSRDQATLQATKWVGSSIGSLG